MAILSTDADFKRKLRKIPKADREDLWKELNEAASFLALIGATSEAVKVWTFAYSGLVPMPDPEDRTISVFGDGAVSAVCYQLKLPDISKGKPPPRFRGRDGTTTVAGGLQKRVVALDSWSRQRITSDAWSATCDWDNPQPDLIPTATYRKARLLAQPKPSGRVAATELDSLSLLSRLCDNQAIYSLHPCYQADAFLLAADIAARHERLEEARRFLELWHDCSIDWDYSVGEAFGLIPIARLICDGVLAKKHTMSPQSRQRMVKMMVEALEKRLSKPEPPKPPRWRYKLSFDYGQFYLEPLEIDPQVVYFQENGEGEQGFSSFPYQVAFGVPDSDGDCTVEVVFGKRIPAVETAVQAVAVPLTVKAPGGLYLRMVNDHGKKMRLEVPKGKYDVVARFFPRKPAKCDEGACFASWRAVLTFLPPGTVGPKCIKLPDRAPPDNIVLHGRHG